MRKVRVVVVEDHPATARGLKMFLEVSGYAVEIADSMRSALQRAETLEFDVLLCDLSLPDGDGWQLMERLSARQPVTGIAFSAFNEPEHLARSKAAGFVEHVVKGSTSEALIAAIERALHSPERVKGGGSLVGQPAANRALKL